MMPTPTICAYCRYYKDKTCTCPDSEYFTEMITDSDFCEEWEE